MLTIVLTMKSNNKFIFNDIKNIYCIIFRFYFQFTGSFCVKMYLWDKSEDRD